MSEDFGRKVDRIFSTALELSGPDQDAYVVTACDGDTRCLERVRQLIVAANSNVSIEQNLSESRRRLLHELSSDTAAAEQEDDLSGQHVGQWRIVKQIARGGLATVYLAERDDGEFEQTVAIKVLRRGLDTDDLVARFRAERQILSALEHPSIARILDGGSLDDGRPYLVLEYIDGLALTDYCEQHALSTRERVKLIMAVLQSLQHAHRHLVVHRDVKPSNILVAGDGRVSLLDFGIAKLLDPTAYPGGALQTKTGVSMMTPGYSSPEQREGAAVTTASDIFQTGAVLFEMLTGTRPSLDDIAAGQPPSRQTVSQESQEQLRGDLDAILMKAMHHEPERRYASAEEMHADLARWLDGRPVLAQGDSLGYRLKTFQRRMPWVMPGTALVCFVLLGFVTTLLVYNAQLKSAEIRAEGARHFMVNLLQSADPFRPADPELGSDITVLEALDVGVRKLRAENMNDPLLSATLLASISSVYASLDQHEDAIDLRQEALSLETRLYGEHSQAVVSSLFLLAEQAAAMGEYDLALDYSARLVADASVVFGTDHPATGAARVTAAAIHASLGNFEHGERLFEQGLAELRKSPVGYEDALVKGLVAYSKMLLRESSPDILGAQEALGEAQQLVDENFASDDLAVALVQAQSAAAYRLAGQNAAAERDYAEALEHYEKAVGKDHRITLSALTSYGLFQLNLGNPARAEEVLRDVLSRYTKKYGRQHRDVADGYQNLATAIRQQGRFAEAVAMHRTAFEIYDQLPMDQHFLHALPLLSIAHAELELNRSSQATKTARSAEALLMQTAPDSFLVGIAQCLRALGLEQSGQTLDSDRLMLASHQRLRGSAISRRYRETCRLTDAATEPNN